MSENTKKMFLNLSIKMHTAARWTCEAYGKGIVAQDPKGSLSPNETYNWNTTAGLHE